MLEWVHDHWLGHRYERIDEGDQPVFVCCCTAHWWPGFTLHHPTKRDQFIHASVANTN
jgi:hypothetical protein